MRKDYGCMAVECFPIPTYFLRMVRDYLRDQMVTHNIEDALVDMWCTSGFGVEVVALNLMNDRPA